jgi:predicted nucleotidyltransferase
MEKTEATLNKVLTARLSEAPEAAKESFHDATEVIIFGSMAAGLDRFDSDIDVLCIGNHDYKLKSRSMDLIAVPCRVTEAQSWLGTELATHVVKYGIWIKGVPQWKNNVYFAQTTIEAKRRRICAFLTSLQHPWFRLQGCFREKYSVKLRRETQRLILLERNTPIPPTRALDEARVATRQPTNEVCERLRQLSPSTGDHWLEDLIGRVDAHFLRGQPASCK